jgi:hypothetical protein
VKKEPIPFRIPCENCGRVHDYNADGVWETCGATEGPCAVERKTMRDDVPRYAPDAVLIVGHGLLPVVRYVSHPPRTHPQSPLFPYLTALEAVTRHGSRWWGFDRAWINSELRMVVQGFPAADEMRSRWEVCHES